MENEITIIDYGLGNLKAFYNIYNDLNIPVKISSKEEDLKNAKKLILPGVGSFDYAMEKINNLGIRNVLNQLVLIKKVPILGVCVGMHIMASSSEEGTSTGLSWIKASVNKLNNNTKLVKKEHKENYNEFSNRKLKIILPHMGWNNISIIKDSILLNDIKNPWFYFLHSYYFLPFDSNLVLSETVYNRSFCSVFKKDNIYGVQFHPEKSHDWGRKLLLNFSSL